MEIMKLVEPPISMTGANLLPRPEAGVIALIEQELSTLSRVVIAGTTMLETIIRLGESLHTVGVNIAPVATFEPNRSSHDHRPQTLGPAEAAGSHGKARTEWAEMTPHRSLSTHPDGLTTSPGYVSGRIIAPGIPVLPTERRKPGVASIAEPIRPTSPPSIMSGSEPGVPNQVPFAPEDSRPADLPSTNQAAPPLAVAQPDSHHEVANSRPPEFRVQQILLATMAPDARPPDQLPPPGPTSTATRFLPGASTRRYDSPDPVVTSLDPVGPGVDRLPAQVQEGDAGTNAAARQGTIVLDGAQLGRWMLDHLAMRASRPGAGTTGIDPRINALYPGAHSGD